MNLVCQPMRAQLNSGRSVVQSNCSVITHRGLKPASVDFEQITCSMTLNKLFNLSKPLSKLKNKNVNNKNKIIYVKHLVPST